MLQEVPILCKKDEHFWPVFPLYPELFSCTKPRLHAAPATVPAQYLDDEANADGDTSDEEDEASDPTGGDEAFIDDASMEADEIHPGQICHDLEPSSPVHKRLCRRDSQVCCP